VSIAARPKRPSETFVPSSISKSAPSTSPTFTRRNRVAEAPDRGNCTEEAPESHRGGPAEAPEAGAGRGAYLEREFTRGRSQS
jgi:hypothetical protein